VPELCRSQAWWHALQACSADGEEYRRIVCYRSSRQWADI
jgi:hypothetical protein